jgi:hypothetical protein
MHVDPLSAISRHITPQFVGIPQQRFEADKYLAPLGFAAEA